MAALTLCKIVLLAAFPEGDPTATDAGLEALGDRLADQIRALGALTVASEYDRDTATLTDGDDTDAVCEALTARFPEEGAR